MENILEEYAGVVVTLVGVVAAFGLLSDCFSLLDVYFNEMMSGLIF